MIDRTGRSLPLTTIAAVALALCALLDVGARPAHAQLTGDNFPCSVRREIHECQAECTDSQTFLRDCFCIWDSRSAPAEGTCPPGEVCCWNMPCEKYDDVNGGNAFECVRGGGGETNVPPGNPLIPKNCSWNADSGECRCTPPLVNAGYDAGDLSAPTPGKTYRAPLDCVCPFTTVEQWLRLDVCNPPGVSKLAIKLNFAKPANDSIGLKGTLAVPADFAVGGAALEVSIGGVVKTFTLDAKGKAKVGTDQTQLAVKAKKGVVAAQDAKLSIKLTKGSFASSLADDGLDDATVAGVAVTMTVEIKLNDTMYAKAQPQLYSAKAGKTGSAKSPK